MTMDSGGSRHICPCRRNAASPVAPLRERRLARRTRRAATWALPSVALALVPKCPMCIAAYLAIGGGLGVSFTTAAHLRTALVWLCWGMLALLAARMTMRFRARFVVAARQVFRSAQRNARGSSAPSAAA
jgi:hypothetical protein